MDPATKSILQSLPDRVVWTDVPEFERLDERVSAIEWMYGDIIDMGDSWVGWCPNNDPPTFAETLAWWWVARPDLGNEIGREADEEFRESILDYIANSTASADANREIDWDLDGQDSR